MIQRIRKQLSPGLVLGVVAVFLVLGGGAYAALGKNSVGSKQLKKNAVVTSKIKKNAVTTAKIRNGAVTGAKVKVATLGTVPSAQNAVTVTGHQTFPQTRLVASSAATVNAALTAATEVPIFTVGPVTIYAKCYTDTSVPKTFMNLFIKTSENGFLFEGDDDEADGNPFLNVGTAEIDRALMDANANLNDATFFAMHSNEVDVSGPGGINFEARIQIGVKNGTLAGGNGIYGEGDVCIAAGDLTEF